MTRRSLLAALTMAAALMLSPGAHAQNLLGMFTSAEYLTFCSGGREISVERYRGYGHCVRPAVIILHGTDGLCKYGPQYRQAARQLAGAGYDAFIVRYFDATGTVLIEDERRGAIAPAKVRKWVQATRDAVRFVQSLDGVDPHAVGVVGFSLGAYVGTSAAVNNRNVRAIVAVSGGIPEEAAAAAKSLPPVFIVHGCADEIVPVSEAYRLRSLARKLGAPAGLLALECEGHSLSAHASKEAARESLRFLDAYLY